MSADLKNVSDIEPKGDTIRSEEDVVRRLREEVLRYRRENLRQAQRALEIANLLELIIKPASRE